jgi:hypothetical protein
MIKRWRKLESLAGTLPDHRFAIVALVYAVLVWRAVHGPDANLPGVNEFLRARSPEKTMLYLKSQQRSETPQSQQPPANVPQAAQTPKPDPSKEVKQNAGAGVAKDSHGTAGSKE